MLQERERVTTQGDVPSDLVEIFGAELLAQIQTPLRIDTADSDRRRLSERLVAAAHGERGPLERLRSHFLRRLHRLSSDLAATAGLQVTERALTLVGPATAAPARPVEEGVSALRTWWRRRWRKAA